MSVINFDLKYGGKIRLWFGENKELQFKGEKVERKEYVQATVGKAFSKRTIIAEIFLPRGGRNIYGLLGLEYSPTQSGMLRIKVNTSDNNKLIFSNSLIGKIEPVCTGLPSEYSQCIINEVDLLYVSEKLSFEGELDFNSAAYSEISSNGWIFSKLTNVLLALLNVDENEINSNLIIKLLD